MKKHYEKMCMTPLGMEFESNLLLLNGSTSDNTDVIVAVEQEVETYDFSGSDFKVDWE